MTWDVMVDRRWDEKASRARLLRDPVRKEVLSGASYLHCLCPVTMKVSCWRGIGSRSRKAGLDLCGFF